MLVFFSSLSFASHSHYARHCRVSVPFLTQRMLRICYAYVALRFVSLAYPLRIPCARLILHFQKSHGTLALWHFCFLNEIFGIFETFVFKPLSSIYLQSLIKFPYSQILISKSHKSHYSHLNPVSFFLSQPVSFFFHTLYLFLNPVSFSPNLFLFGLSLFLFCPQREQPSLLPCVFVLGLYKFACLFYATLSIF